MTAHDDGIHVLLVDDHELNRVLLADMLEGTGWIIHQAGDGAATLAIAAEHALDLIVLDINMPGMNGIEVCRRLRANSATAPVLFVTAHDDRATNIAAIEAGGFGFIAKPVLREQFIAYAARAMQAGRTRRELDGTRSAIGHLVHDLRNLVQINQAYLQLLQMAPGLDPDGQELLSLALESAGEMNIMLQSLLDLRRADSTGRLLVERVPVQATTIARQRSRLAASVARGRHLEFQATPDAEAAVLTSDRELLARILDNLLFNAAKFCPEGGRIRVACSIQGDAWFVEVDNDGEAIPEDMQRVLFRDFAQLDQRQVPAGRRGVGLGLAFCREASTVLGGGIRLVSPLPGREDGVRLRVWLPLRRGDANTS